jgi:hypothetical protein
MLMLGPPAPLIAPATAIGARGAIITRWWTRANRLQTALLLRGALGPGLPWGALLLWWTLLLGLPLLLFAWRAGRALAAGGNGSERDAAAILIDIHDPDFEDIANSDDLVRVANETVGQAADVDQAAVGQADIDEDSEIDDVENRAGQLHPLC